MKLTIDDVRSRFIKHFDGSTGTVYASPGRINLIGEHTDYNDDSFTGNHMNGPSGRNAQPHTEPSETTVLASPVLLNGNRRKTIIKPLQTPLYRSYKPHRCPQ